MLHDRLMTDERPPVELTDPRALRAYAHPVRMQLVALLRRRGPLTATQAAVELGESSGTTSFHLRQLAKYGLVEEASGGKGREKPWQATSLMTNVPPLQPTPEATEAANQLRITMAHAYYEKVVEWLRRWDGETDEWRRAALFGDRIMYLTPGELDELKQSIEDLIEPYARRMANPDERPPGAREVSYLRFAFPTTQL
jgi:DNA-binding transcriptional ArsR family regulator